VRSNLSHPSILIAMLPPLLPVETTCLPIPTFQGIVALARNSLTIVDDLGESKFIFLCEIYCNHQYNLAMNHHVVFFIVGMLLWIFPIVFTWPVLPFKVTFEYTLYLLGFEKGRIRGGNYSHHLAFSSDSTFFISFSRFVCIASPEFLLRWLHLRILPFCDSAVISNLW
jgi:hypothetical protein